MVTDDCTLPASSTVGEWSPSSIYLSIAAQVHGERERARHYTCRALQALDVGALAAVLLSFASTCAPAHDAAGRPLSCVIDAGPFGAGSGVGESGGGVVTSGDVEPRMSTALVASNFARATGPPLRVYRVA